MTQNRPGEARRLSESVLILWATINKGKGVFLSLCVPVKQNLHPFGSSSFVSLRCFSFFFSLINVHVPLHVCVKKEVIVYFLTVRFPDP